MKTFLLASTAAVALCSAPAFAADFPVKAAPVQYDPWAGFYIGGHIGWAWGRDNVTTHDINTVDNFASFSQDPRGIFGGAQLGYNLQQGNFVIGVESDLGAINLSKSVSRTNVVNIIPFDTTNSSGFYADLTARVGFIAGPALFYAKGGGALFLGEATVHVADNAAITETSAKTFAGWTIGGGLEYAVSQAWSAKVEYQHFDFRNEPSVVMINTLCCNFDHKLTVDTVQVGLNYHLGSYGR